MKTFLTLFFVYLLAPSVSAKLVSKLSSQLNDYNLNISSQYNIAVFSRSEAHFKNATIWQVAIAKNGSFKTAHKLTLGPKQYRYSDPMLSPDGQTLLFISDMPLASEYKRDDYNIWQASWSLGQWTNIHPLSSVNSEADELSPEIHNGSLYFSSTRSGKLSLYQIDIVNKSSKVTPYKAIQHKRLSQSDLTFSPDGNIALYWQLSEDRKDSILMMQQRTSEGWGLPKMMHNRVQSIAFEFTPQFSPDGQWLYISSARKTDDYQHLNIHKFPTKEIFPHAWYKNNLGKVELDVLANRKQIKSIKTFEYDLNIKQGNSLN
ncbi:PD40 domain-containing protein [Colwellia sp. MB3u-4]|uniref:TolB family protein n=1 Tax=Colwellia sp. MB3u-4 TaxID=2759822 RepID=UPI0015F4C771|nr:PD40 domain-containing protein [Colwellia sp. MB3u-4]MBA6289033.1 PD40 domain-containing protein [Colwellia sp. MB3u-4]